MKKIFIKKFSILFLLVMIFCATLNVSAAQKASLIGMPENTPPENVFMLEGYSQKFILLDATARATDGYFVMLMDFCGTSVFDSEGSQRFNPNKQGSVAYKLNNDFLSYKGEKQNEMGLARGGQIESLASGMPPEMLSHIDFEHIWETEAGNGGGTCRSIYWEKSGLALLSQQELVKYRDKIGRKDTINSTGATGWWLRTGEPSSPDRALCIRLNDDTPPYRENVSNYLVTNGMAMRPVFYLNKDFFKDVKLSTYHLGKNVIDIIKRYHTQDELSKLYTNDALWNIFGLNSGITLTNGELLENGGENLTVKVSAQSFMDSASAYMLVAVYYDGNDVLKSYSLKHFEMQENSIKDVQIELGLPATKRDGKINVFVWDMSNSSTPVSNTLIF